MRAAFYETNGPASDVLRLDEVPTPTPGPGEVRVRLKTSGVNPSDVKSRAGLTRKIAFPRVIPHSDGAGTIDLVGDGVPAGRVAERVWTWNAQWRRPNGTAAEYVVLPQRQAVALPDGVSFEIGAGLGIPALTAWYAVAQARLGTGSRVFIPAGAGSVGFYAIQLAKARGAEVITSISSDAKTAIARRAGADAIINYKREDVAARIAELTGGHGVNAILEVDLGAGARLYPSILRPHGIVVVYGTSAPEHTIPAAYCLTSNITLRFILVYEMPSADIDGAIAGVTKMLRDGKLVHNIALTVPLDDIVAAHQVVESNSVAGKVIVSIA